MKKLGILVNQVERHSTNANTHPLLAFSYARSGFIRLAGFKKPKK